MIEFQEFRTASNQIHSAIVATLETKDITVARKLLDFTGLSYYRIDYGWCIVSRSLWDFLRSPLIPYIMLRIKYKELYDFLMSEYDIIKHVNYVEIHWVGREKLTDIIDLEF